MAFKLMSCPYCGTDIDDTENRFSVCGRCGKKIYSDRADMLAFIPEGEMHDSFEETIECMLDDRWSRAMSIAEDLVESMPGSPDVYILRGAVHAYKGEDGKALNDWRTGIEKLENYTNSDAYICFISNTVADLMCYKELEFIEFDHIRYINDLAEAFDGFLKTPCKFILYFTIFVDYLQKIKDADEDDRDNLEDVLPEMVRMMVSYHRNPACLTNIVDYYLRRLDYVDETYEEDDMIPWHIYHLLSEGIKERLTTLTPEHIESIASYWNDDNMTELEEQFNEILREHGASGGFRVHKKKGGEDEEVKKAVDGYISKYLLLSEKENSKKE